METQVEKTEDKAQQPKPLPVTTGEKWFDAFRFSVGEVFILFLTAVIAYNTRHGKDWFKFPDNVSDKLKVWQHPLRGIQTTAESGFNKLLRVEKLKDKYDFLPMVSGAFAGTLVTFHGGNFFAPVMKYINTRKEDIVTYFNKRWGTQEEIETGKERVKREPKQTWGDVLKGRAAGFTIVLTSFLGVQAITGRAKAVRADGKPFYAYPAGAEAGKSMYWFDVFQEWFARRLAALVTREKDFSKPVNEPLLANSLKKPSYRFGNILAIDVFATTASLTFWIIVSKLSAALRSKKAVVELESADPIIGTGVDFRNRRKEKPENAIAEETLPTPEKRKAILEKRPSDFRSRAEMGADELIPARA